MIKRNALHLCVLMALFFGCSMLQGMIGGFPEELYNELIPENYYKVLSIPYGTMDKDVIKNAYDAKKLFYNNNVTTPEKLAELEQIEKDIDSKTPAQYEKKMVDDLRDSLGVPWIREADESQTIIRYGSFLNQYTKWLNDHPKDNFEFQAKIHTATHTFEANESGTKKLSPEFGVIVTMLLKPENTKASSVNNAINLLKTAFSDFIKTATEKNVRYVMAAIKGGVKNKNRFRAIRYMYPDLFATLIAMVKQLENPESSETKEPGENAISKKLETLKTSLSTLKTKLTNLSGALKKLKSSLSKG